MKIFIVLLLFGEVGGTWGPIPASMDWCVNHSAEFIEIINNGYESGNPPLMYDGREVPLSEMTIGCVELKDRPDLGSEFDEKLLTQPSATFGKTSS